jgi:hypothetical protein
MYKKAINIKKNFKKAKRPDVARLGKPGLAPDPIKKKAGISQQTTRHLEIPESDHWCDRKNKILFYPKTDFNPLFLYIPKTPRKYFRNLIKPIYGL